MAKYGMWVLLIAGVGMALFCYKRYRIPPVVKFENLTFINAATDAEEKLLTDKDSFILVNFFATWCPPCVNEMPSLKRAAEALKNDGVKVVCLSDEPTARVSAFRSKLDFELVIGSYEARDEHRIYTYPTTYLINQRHEVLFEKVGEAEWDSKEMLALLRAALK
jgi:thiol-disulfide isomerase/thioredoxin